MTARKNTALPGIVSTLRVHLPLLLCSLILILAALISGCAPKCSMQPENTPRFVPVAVEYQVNVHEPVLEKTISKVLLDNSCMFAQAGDTKPFYVLQISYLKVTDLKTTLLYLMSLSMAELPATFLYTLNIHILNNDKLCKEYQYQRRNRETTDPMVASMLNPLHDSHAASKKIFAALAEEFLHDLASDRPLPFSTP